MSIIRQGTAEKGLGEEMYEAFKMGKVLPQADVQITQDDPPTVRRMKELIVEMTAYEASDRPTIQQVLAVLAKLNAQVNADDATVPHIEAGDVTPQVEADDITPHVEADDVTPQNQQQSDGDPHNAGIVRSHIQVKINFYKTS